MACEQLGGLVEFLHYVFVFDEGTGLYTVYSPSYPETKISGSSKENILEELKNILSNLVL